MSGYIKRIAAYTAAHIKLVTIAITVLGTCLIVVCNHYEISKEVIGEVAGLVNLIAYLPYYVSIMQGKTKPNKVTWWTWAVLEIMMSSSYIMAGAGNTKWLPIAAFIGMLFTAILSLKFGDKKWYVSDFICAVGSAVGLVIWILSGDPVIALIAFLVVDLFAAIPTCIKAWDEPYEEDLFAWVISLISGLVNLVALESLNFSIVVLPVYNLVVYLAVVALLKLGRKYNTP